MTLPPFTGFPTDGFRFYAELGDDAHNTKGWFDANRHRYEDSARVPMEALLERADAEGFGNGKVFRPNRDVRFSSDKRPYKAHCGAVIGFRDGTATASRYVQLDAEGLLAAAGYWELARDQLDRFRRLVDDDRAGGELQDLVDEARRAGLEIMGEELKRGPRGFPLDHPRATLLRHRRLAVGRRWPVERWMHTPEAYERVAATWREAAPVAAWLERHVGASAEPRGPRGG